MKSSVLFPKLADKTSGKKILTKQILEKNLNSLAFQEFQSTKNTL
jgi:hypothetical protein